MQRIQELEIYLVENEKRNLINWFFQFGLTFTTTTNKKMNSLFYAILHKDLPFIEFLFELGFDFQYIDLTYGNALFFALKEKKFDVAIFFRSNGLIPFASSPAIYDLFKRLCN